jgi:hypothetical protein
MRQTGVVGEVLCPVLVGRRPEIQALESALAGALAGHGGCAVITGEAGIGKSRLIRELAQMAADRQVLVATGRAVPASTSAPYRPVTEALLQLLRRRPLPDDPSLAPWLPHLTALLPGAVADDPAARLGRGVDSQAVRGEAVLRLLRRLGPDGLMVALEDLHWADPDTVSLVEYLADNAVGQPVLFAVSLRTEPRSPASELARRQRGRAGIVHLPLGRLSEREVAEMIAACRSGADERRAVPGGEGFGGRTPVCGGTSGLARHPGVHQRDGTGTAGRVPRRRARCPRDCGSAGASLRLEDPVGGQRAALGGGVPGSGPGG